MDVWVGGVYGWVDGIFALHFGLIIFLWVGVDGWYGDGGMALSFSHC